MGTLLVTLSRATTALSQPKDDDDCSNSFKKNEIFFDEGDGFFNQTVGGENLSSSKRR